MGTLEGKTSISGQTGIDLGGPSVDASGEVDGSGEADGTEEAHRPGAADAVVAVDDDLGVLLGRQFVDALGEFAERDQDGAGKGDELVLAGFPDVE